MIEIKNNMKKSFIFADSANMICYFHVNYLLILQVTHIKQWFNSFQNKLLQQFRITKCY